MAGAEILLFRGRPVIIDNNYLQPQDFNSLTDLRRLAESFGGNSPIKMTKEAWLKYKSLIDKPVEG